MNAATPNAQTSSSDGVDKLCAYRRRACSRAKYEGYKYCAQHVLEDETSPFTSCEYLSRTSKRKCPNPALRQRKSNSLPTFCEEHLRDLIAKEKLQKVKKKLKKRKKAEKWNLEHPDLKQRNKLIDQLMLYQDDKNAKTSHADEISGSEMDEVHRPITDGWLLDNNEDLRNDADWDDFDPVNNEVYEPLRYADVLTPEEVVATAQSKLIRLQSLYIEQFKRLFHLLKERRRQYIHERKKEDKEERSGKTPKAILYETKFNEDQIRALAGFRKRTGVEALMSQRQKKRRLEASGGTVEFLGENSSSSIQPRCAHASNHTRCRGMCLPYTKFCTKHILEDPHQLLYKKCKVENCPTPVCHLMTHPFQFSRDCNDDEAEDAVFCLLHAPLPEMTFKFTKEEKLDHANIKMEDEISTDYPTVSNVVPDQQSNAVEEEPMEIDVKNVASTSSMTTTSQPSITASNTKTSSDTVLSVKSSEKDNISSEADSNVNTKEISLFPTSIYTSIEGPNTNDDAINNESTQQPKDLKLAEEHTHLTHSNITQDERVDSPTQNDKIILPATSQSKVLYTSPNKSIELEPMKLPTVNEDIPSNVSKETEPSGEAMADEANKVPISADSSTNTNKTESCTSNIANKPSLEANSTVAADTIPIISIPDPQQSSSPSKPEDIIEDITEVPIVQNNKETRKENDEKSLPVEGEAGISTDKELPSSSFANSTISEDKIIIIPGETNPAPRKEPEDAYVLDPETGWLINGMDKAIPDNTIAKDKIAEDNSGIDDPLNMNNNSSKSDVAAAKSCEASTPVATMDSGIEGVGTGNGTPIPASALPIPPAPVYDRQHSFSGRGERKPSSADEEMAVVSLLSLRSGHPSDDNSHSSSTDAD